MEESIIMKKKKIFKTLGDMEGSKFDYSKLVKWSGDYEYFDFTKFGPLSSFYLKLIKENIGINVAKSKNEIDRLKIKKAKKKQNSQTKQSKKMC